MADIVVQFRGTVYENGYGQIAQKVMRDKTIHAVAKAIYAYLVSFAGQDGSAFPSVELMMEELGIKSEDTFYKYRKQLLNAGYISIEQQQRVKGQFYNNVYIIELLPYHKKSSTEPHPNSSSTVNSSTKKSGIIINSSSQISDLQHNQLKTTTEEKPAVVANSEELDKVINEIESRLHHPIRSLYKHLPRWIDEHGANQLIAHAEYIASIAQTKGLRNIVGAYRLAVEEVWDTTITPLYNSQTALSNQRDERYAAFYELFPQEP